MRMWDRPNHRFICESNRSSCYAISFCTYFKSSIIKHWKYTVCSRNCWVRVLIQLTNISFLQCLNIGEVLTIILHSRLCWKNKESTAIWEKFWMLVKPWVMSLITGHPFEQSWVTLSLLHMYDLNLKCLNYKKGIHFIVKRCFKLE